MATNTAWLIVEKLASLLTAEFPTGKVYKADLLYISRFPKGGTFCIEIAGGPNPMGEPSEESPTETYWDKYNFVIYVYLRYLDKESGQEDIMALVENFVAFMRERVQATTNVWWSSQITGIRYGLVEAEKRTKPFLRVAGIEWTCQVEHPRRN